ncbi:MAG: ABC transporter substrate-binding protein, partial [Syntrophobacteraceae bacterium]|nr:ABC transporter substrate-binding protein [Syntrophobacteraceae bacterium]
QTLVVKPLRANPGDTEVIVRSELRTPGRDPVQLDYRVEKTEAGWKVYDLNVLGVWLVETYRGQFAQEIKIAFPVISELKIAIFLTFPLSSKTGYMKLLKLPASCTTSLPITTPCTFTEQLMIKRIRNR